jgi:predicted metal-binding membrane protein
VWLADVRRGAVAKAPATNAETRRIFWPFYDECCYCQGLLMAVMFAAGTGSLGWMLTLGALMGIEKNSRHGRRLAPVLGIGLICAALWLTVVNLVNW